MSDNQREAFEKINPVPDGAKYNDSMDGYYKADYYGTIRHPFNELYESFKDGWLAALLAHPSDDYLDSLMPPTPTKPQWRGPEDGLPPVGVECESHPYWHHCYIVAEYAGGVIVHDMNDDDFYHAGFGTKFRQIISDRERAIEIGAKHAGYPDCTATIDVVAKLVDAGWKPPQEPK